MALPFLKNGTVKKREEVVAVDLGNRTTKAVRVRCRGDVFSLCSFAVLDAPIFEKNLSVELLTEHLKAVSLALDAKTKLLVLTLGVNDAVVRHAEMPYMPLDDMRMVLKLNPKSYLQQDLTNYIYDCYALPPEGQKGTQPLKAPAGQPKQRILVAGARKQLIDDLVAGARNAGMIADRIVPSLIGTPNAFEKTHADIFAKEVVALIDLGFKNSSICILQEGDLALSRVVAIGGDKLTNGLAESLGVSYAEAEGIKVGMPGEVQAQLENLILPLGRELRASIDFYEHQSDKAVTQIFLTGGSARSEFIVERLQHELLIECKIMNPINFLRLDLPPQQTAEIEQVAPQLTVALGAALSAL